MNIVKTFTDGDSIRMALGKMLEYPMSERPFLYITYEKYNFIHYAEGTLIRSGGVRVGASEWIKIITVDREQKIIYIDDITELHVSDKNIERSE